MTMLMLMRNKKYFRALKALIAARLLFPLGIAADTGPVANACAV